MKKLLLILIPVIVCIVGAVCGFKTYASIAERGRVVGEIEHYNPYSDFNKFGYNLTGECFYESSSTTGVYEIVKEYPVPNEEVDFNEQRFDVIINNKPCYNVKVYERIIFAETEITFVNLYGYDIGSVKLNVQFEYWVDKTVIKITVPDCPDITRLNTYLDIYGLKIRIIEGQHECWQYDDAKERVKIMYFDGCDNLIELTSVNVYENKTVRDVYSQLPELSLPGFKLEGWTNLSTATDKITDSELNKVLGEELGGYSYTFYPIFKGVGDYGLYDNNDTQVMSLENLVKNGYLFYYGNNALKTMTTVSQDKLSGKLVLPTGITELEIFDSNLNIFEIVIPNTVKSLGVYGSCESVVDFDVPSSVTEITSLEGFKNVEFIYIPETVVSFFTTALNNFNGYVLCQSLDTSKYEIYNSDKVFYGFSKEIYTVAKNDIDSFVKFGLFDRQDKMLIPWRNLEVNNYITSTSGGYKVNEEYKDLINGVLKVSDKNILANYAFAGCSNLYGVELYRNRISISGYAFQNCINLRSVVFSEGIDIISQYAFAGCKSLSKINLPSSLVGLGPYAFSESGICCIEIPVNLTAISDYAFYNCRNLRSVNLPETLKKIGQASFQGCYNLETIELPTSLNTLSDKAFYGCGSLKKIIIPDNITTLYVDTFANCYSLNEVKLSANLQNIYDRVFQNCIELSHIYIPESVSYITETAFDITTNLYCGKVTKPNGYHFKNSAIYGYTYEQYLSTIK